MKMSVFVRIRPDRTEEPAGDGDLPAALAPVSGEVGPVDLELEELVALAGAPLALDLPAE